MELQDVEAIIEEKVAAAKLWLVAHVWMAVIVAVAAGWFLGKVT